MQLSNRQRVIGETWDNTDQNILISAGAGSGKTTVLLMLLEKCEHRALFLAFNKSIQAEIQQKIDERGLEQGKAMTFHSLGLAALRNIGKTVRINSNKNWDLLKKVQLQGKHLYKKFPGTLWMRMNFSLMDLNDASRTILSDDIDVLEEYLLSLDKSLPDIPELNELWEIFIKVRQDSYTDKVLEIDFLDMLYLPVIKDMTIPIYATYLFIDEAQDMNNVQHLLIDKLLAEPTLERWVAVGDRNQAIYGFSGADSRSFDRFLDKPNVIELPLDICYRCGTNIVDSANKVYDVMTSPPNMLPGIVENVSSIEDIKPRSMVICRNTNPLFEIYFKLLGAGKVCYINGKDIMTNLVKFAKQYQNTTVKHALIEMEYTLEDLQEKATNDNGKIKYHVYKENTANFTSIVKHLGKPTEKVSEVLEKLKTLFENQEDAIMLCTIHKSKGLENDIVYIVNESTTIPSKFAKSAEQLKQEKNLKYVARTRAKKEMYFLNITLNNAVNLEE